MPDICAIKPTDCVGSFSTTPGLTRPAPGVTSGTFAHSFTLQTSDELDSIPIRFNFQPKTQVHVEMHNTLWPRIARFHCYGVQCISGGVHRASYDYCEIVSPTFDVSCVDGYGTLELVFGQPWLNGEPDPNEVCSYDVSLAWSI
jgi:hypothetical protein